MGLQTEVFADEIELEEQRLHAFDIESLGVVAVIVLHAADGIVAFREEFVVVQVTGVAGNAEVVACNLPNEASLHA